MLLLKAIKKYLSRTMFMPRPIFTGKPIIMQALMIWLDYSALTEEIESCHRAPKFKGGDGVRITK